MYNIIAIDGPSGSGKGTIAKEVAKRLNYTYIDTGAMYRCVSLKSLRENISEEDEDKIVELLKNMDIKLTNDGKVYMDNEDVSSEIRTMEVTARVSKISCIIPLRLVMEEKQREMAKNQNIVMEGRDITTVIFPNAKYKFYIDCSLEERAKRRLEQNKEKNIESSYEEVYESLKQRDYNDMNRPLGALKRTPDQHYIDNGKNTKEESVNEILKIVGEE
ncbi:MAG: (d)CMP kinase [Bacilli bacterium]|nr:(d)CMP kinase [Bacilli bacterium]